MTVVASPIKGDATFLWLFKQKILNLYYMKYTDKIVIIGAAGVNAVTKLIENEYPDEYLVDKDVQFKWETEIEDIDFKTEEIILKD